MVWVCLLSFERGRECCVEEGVRSVFNFFDRYACQSSLSILRPTAGSSNDAKLLPSKLESVAARYVYLFLCQTTSYGEKVPSNGNKNGVLRDQITVVV